MNPELRYRKAIDGRIPVTRDEWRKKHRDFKGNSPELGRTMMGMGDHGGSVLYPVVIVGNDATIEVEPQTREERREEWALSAYSKIQYRKRRGLPI